MSAKGQQLVTKAAFGRQAGVSSAAVSKATAAGGPLAPAVVGARIDKAHPAATAYLERHAKKEKRPPKAKPKARSAAAIPADVVPEDIEALADFTLRDLITRFGTDTAFLDWLKAVKAIEDIAEKRLKNAEAAGRLIPRELVRTHIFGAIEATHTRLLSDAPKTLARKIYAAAKSDQPVEEAEAMIRKAIGAQLQGVKAKATRALRNA